MKKDFSSPVCPVFSDGVYFAANAVSDMALVTDAPDCYMNKTTRLSGSHDWFSTLARIPEPHHTNTKLSIPACSMGDTSALENALLKTVKDPNISAVALTAASMVEATHRDYDSIIFDLEEKYEKPILSLTIGELHLDWLDGYIQAQKLLAKQIELPDCNIDPNKVAVVGFFFDRNEADNLANTEEIRSLIQALGLETSSIWFSGCSCKELQKVAEAGIIVSLPYGKSAAHELSYRTGAELVEAPLPVGADACAEFLRVIAKAAGKEKLAEKVITDKEAEILPKLQIAVDRYLVGSHYIIIGDPVLTESLVNTLSFFGSHPMSVFVTTEQKHVDESWLNGFDVPKHFAPKGTMLGDEITIALESGKMDFTLTPTLAIPAPYEQRKNLAIVEIGYNSYFTHHLLPMPYMGYNGILGIVERIANKVAYKNWMTT